jgi:ParB family transcriptional regulator, chromosome partitioning protein
MASKNVLGRGLGALIEDADSPRFTVSAINEIDLNQIELNPFQPRKNFDEESLRELASSIKEMGIIQPITVRELDGNKYQLITGERRYKAARMAGLESIPAYVRKANDQNMLEMSLVENIQRVDLDSIEVAISYQRLIEECNLTQEMVSDRVGKKRSTITNYLRLLKLPAEIQLGIRDKVISMGHARAVINITDPETQLEIYRDILKNDLSVRKVEEIVRKIGTASESQPETKQVEVTHKEYDLLRTHLSEFFQTSVELKRNNKGNGKIVIPFKSDEDLERILTILDKLKSV